jgi:hypothetical protein
MRASSYLSRPDGTRARPGTTGGAPDTDANQPSKVPVRTRRHRVHHSAAPGVSSGASSGRQAWPSFEHARKRSMRVEGRVFATLCSRSARVTRRRGGKRHSAPVLADFGEILDEIAVSAISTWQRGRFRAALVVPLCNILRPPFRPSVLLGEAHGLPIGGGLGFPRSTSGGRRAPVAEPLELASAVAPMCRRNRSTCMSR